MSIWFSLTGNEAPGAWAIICRYRRHGRRSSLIAVGGRWLAPLSGTRSERGIIGRHLEGSIRGDVEMVHGQMPECRIYFLMRYATVAVKTLV